MTVWSLKSALASGVHMSPVSAKRAGAHRRSLAADADMQRGAVHRNALDFEIRRKRLNGGKSRRRAEHRRDRQNGNRQRTNKSIADLRVVDILKACMRDPVDLYTDEYDSLRNGQASQLIIYRAV
jgi:hypothetical protein